jgi:hypothetical protein
VPLSCGFLAFPTAADKMLALVTGLNYFVSVFNGSDLLAVVGRDKGATQIWLSEARALLAERLGGASELAEKLLREEGTAGRLPWGYLRKKGDAADDEFWRCARIEFEENSARVGITFFWVGGGRPPTDVLRSTEYLGIWVSRASVLALLPEPNDGPGLGYQAARVDRALDRLEAEGRKLSDSTDAELRRLALEQIPEETGFAPPSRQTLDRVIRRRLMK